MIDVLREWRALSQTALAIAVNERGAIFHASQGEARALFDLCFEVATSDIDIDIRIGALDSVVTAFEECGGRSRRRRLVSLLEELLWSPVPDWRCEAAICLGRLRWRGAVAALESEAL